MTDPIEQPNDVLPEHRRAIKSFVMRAGRMTTGQQRGLELGWPKFGLELEN
ncbi:MAG TPA: tRNA (guanosine(46)-N7)-methyltransferase TrmB, partial [Pseudomonas sp.]|nr:tRNA (guanosine(46)-N7)-methyltransferase TrmB [Pseudomonas sp.]